MFLVLHHGVAVLLELGETLGFGEFHELSELSPGQFAEDLVRFHRLEPVGSPLGLRLELLEECHLVVDSFRFSDVRMDSEDGPATIHPAEVSLSGFGRIEL
jgi:hypothetical protein